jgi:hypothetical protein
MSWFSCVWLLVLYLKNLSRSVSVNFNTIIYVFELLVFWEQLEWQVFPERSLNRQISVFRVLCSFFQQTEKLCMASFLWNGAGQWHVD